jgi:outer membrane protein assembly factor BamB
VSGAVAVESAPASGAEPSRPTAQAVRLDSATVGFPAPNWTDTVGPIALSSPTVATIDGVEAVVFGSEDGELYVVNAATGANLPGWPEPVDLSGSTPTAIESSPTVADLDGPGKPPSIIVGAGSTYVADQQGGLVAFRENGTVRFTFHTFDTFNEWSGASNPAPIGYDNGVFSTPAVGELTGNGQQDIVFGSYDHNLYALTPKGTLVPGFPIDTEDTIWSSPALVHVRGKRAREDIFVGGDATGRRGCYGGFLYDVTYVHHAPRIVWQHCENQTIWSSPAVGVINATGRLAVVVGTGFGEPPPYKSDTDKVFAFFANNGARVPGWPVRTTGPVFGSPAIGTIGPSDEPAVVDTSWCTSCAAKPGTSMLYAWSGSGTLLWSQSLQGAQDFSSPVLVDLTGSGENDVLIGSAAGLYPIDGATGDFLFGTSESSAINNCSMQGAPAVVELPGSVPGAGWQLFEACGGPHELIATGRLIDYPLPTIPATPPPWPMWRSDPAHDGVPAGE